MNKNQCTLLILIALSLPSSNADCNLDSTNMKESSPIVLKHDYNSFTELVKAIKLPNLQKISIRNGAITYLACPDSYMHIDGVQQSFAARQFRCTKGKLDGTFFSNILCNTIPKSTIRSYTPEKFEVGFNINGNFLTAYDGSFDNVIKATRYTQHIISNKIKDLVINSASTSFKELACPIPEVHCEHLYSFVKQVDTITGLFENSRYKDTVKEYFKNGSKYLARGHLVAHRDYNFPYAQKATYYFNNVVPQWQQINNGNWKRLEGDIRQLAAKTKDDLTVYTGTHQISQLFATDLYLYVNGSTKYVPVPKFMWKVVMTSDKAVAFVMSNNPNDELESKSFSCQDVCSQLTYVKVGRYNTTDGFKKGYLYCCRVTRALCEAINNIPITPDSDMPVLT